MMKSLYAAFVVGACMAAVICNLAAQTAASPDGSFFIARSLQDGNTVIFYGTGKSQSEILAGAIDKKTSVITDPNHALYCGKAKFGQVNAEYRFAWFREPNGRVRVTPRIKSVVTGHFLVPEREIVLDRL